MNVRIKISIFSIFICFLSSCVETDTSENFEKKTLPWQGVDREYLIFLPTSYSSEEELPLVIGLHGYTGTASGFEKETTKVEEHVEISSFDSKSLYKCCWREWYGNPAKGTEAAAPLALFVNVIPKILEVILASSSNVS